MTAYRFLTPTWAQRFARNARSRGYRVTVRGCVVVLDQVVLDQVDRQFLTLVQRYAGLPVGKDAKR